MLQLLKFGEEVVYERSLVDSKITNWYLSWDKFIYQEDTASNKITYLKLSCGQVQKTKQFVLPGDICVKSQLITAELADK